MVLESFKEDSKINILNIFVNIKLSFSIFYKCNMCFASIIYGSLEVTQERDAKTTFGY